MDGCRIQHVKGREYNEGQVYTHTSAQPTRDRPRVEYYQTMSEPDPYPYPSLLDPLDNTQHDDVIQAIEHMLLEAWNNRLQNASGIDYIRCCTTTLMHYALQYRADHLI